MAKMKVGSTMRLFLNTVFLDSYFSSTEVMMDMFGARENKALLLTISVTGGSPLTSLRLNFLMCQKGKTMPPLVELSSEVSIICVQNLSECLS